MKRTTVGSALVVGALMAAACGGGSGDASTSPGDDTASTAVTESTTAQVTTDAPSTTEATTTTTTEAVEASTTTAQVTTDAPTTTEAAPTTVEASTTTAAPPPAIPDPPPAGTGILTVGDVEFPFTIETCNLEPAPAPVGDSIIVFEVRGSTIAEGQPAEARLLRIASLSGAANDSFGWGYASDPGDFESLRSESSPFGIGEHIIVEQTDAGVTFYGPPTQFERTEGISVMDDVDPGLGSIIATC